MDQNLKAYNDMANRRKDPKMDKAIAKESLRSYNKNTPMKRDRVAAGFKARRQAKMKDLLKNAVGALGRVASPVAAGASAIKNFRKKKPDFQKGDYSGIKIKRAGGGMSSGQAAIAAKAPPPNKIDAKDFAVLRKEKARGRGMGLQDESVKPGKVMKADMGKFIGKLTKPIRRIFGKGTKTAASGMNQPNSVGLGRMLPDLLQKAIDDGTIKTAKHGKIIKARVGKSITKKIPLAGKATSVGSTTMKGMKFSDKAKMVDSGKINKATGKFTSMEALRESVGYRAGESTDKFNKRRMALAAAKKAASASTVGKIALAVGVAGLGAKKYLESKMNKKKDVKKKMGGGMMMQRPMGYSEGTSKAIRPGPLGRAGRSALTPAGRRASPSQPPPKKKERPALVVQFGVKEGPAKQNTTIKTVKIKNREELKKTLSSRMSGGMMKKYSKGGAMKKGYMGGGMMKPMGYKHGTSVTASCKLGRNKPTKIT